MYAERKQIKNKGMVMFQWDLLKLIPDFDELARRAIIDEFGDKITAFMEHY